MRFSVGGVPEAREAEELRRITTKLEQYAGVPLDPASVAAEAAAPSSGDECDQEQLVRRFKSEYFGTLTLTPPFADLVLNQVRMLVSRPDEPGLTYSHADRILVDLVLSYDLDYTAILPIHIDEALELGLPAELFDALATGREDRLPAGLRHRIAFIREVIAGDLDDESLERVAGELGQRGALEFAVFILSLQMLFRLHQAIGVSEPSWETIAELQSRAVRGYKN